MMFVYIHREPVGDKLLSLHRLATLEKMSGDRGHSVVQNLRQSEWLPLSHLRCPPALVNRKCVKKNLSIFKCFLDLFYSHLVAAGVKGSAHEIRLPLRHQRHLHIHQPCFHHPRQVHYYCLLVQVQLQVVD